MNVNPFQLINLIKNGMNPQQLIMSLLSQNGGQNNPIINNAMGLAQKGDVSNLESIARNLAKQKGIDFDKQFSNFMNYFK